MGTPQGLEDARVRSAEVGGHGLGAAAGHPHVGEAAALLPGLQPGVRGGADSGHGAQEPQILVGELIEHRLLPQRVRERIALDEGDVLVVEAGLPGEPMTTTIDKAGRVVIPAEVRKRLGLTAGAELEMRIEGFSIRLVRAVAGPQLVRRGKRLVACPQAAEGERTEVDVARLIEEERDRRPG
ncbi:MAG: AbrB/MazE/SpoVT family DNA-binding domain-containing protein [Acidobacteria bacterium]|nr:AbrB/MazE/SpoVT family DNA-binding domain-containing protein [Acidobacteriota bacterium]